jgi:hypothetical protein
VSPALVRALELARQGGRVFPCHWIERGKCSCGEECGNNAGKHPLWEKETLEHGKDNATSDERRIRAWAEKWPLANWAFVPASLGWVVIDVDGAEGRQAFTALPGCESLPDTYTVRTGRPDGIHAYLQLPLGAAVKDGDLVPRLVTVKSGKGYVMLPGCLHHSGRRYTAANPQPPVAPCPDWLLARITSPSPSCQRARGDGIIRTGERRSTFFRRGCALRRRGMDRDGILAALIQEHPRCEQPPEGDHGFTEAEVSELVDNICQSFLPGPLRPDARQPLREFLLTARHKNNLDFITRSTYHTALFDFVRLLKSRAEFDGMNGMQAAERIERELGNIWQEWFADVSDDPRAQLVADWSSARSAAGDDDALDVAWREAQRCPVAPAHFISERYCRLLALCAVLQRKAGLGNPFPLPQVRIGELLGCDYTTIGSYIKCAMKDRLLRRDKPCVPHSKAAEYVYSGPGLLPEGLLPEGPPLSPESISPERNPTLTRTTEYQDGIGESASGKSAHPKNAIPRTEKGCYVEFEL